MTQLQQDEGAAIWWNGEMQPWSSARLHMMSKGLQYSVSAFEGLRAYAGVVGLSVFRLEDHTRRLRRSTQILGIDLSWSDGDLNAAQLAIASRVGEAYIRTAVFLNSGEAGLSGVSDVEVGIAAWAWPPIHCSKADGINVKLSRFRKTFAAPELAAAKASAHYMPVRLALRDAQAAGCDDAILLDGDGFVSEATTSNIFVVKGGLVRTPSLGTPLAGITRDTVMVLLKSTGVQVDECELTPCDLREADEIFLTGTAAEITPVALYEGRRLPGRTGEITRAIIESYSATVRGRSEQFRSWLSSCPGHVSAAA